MSIESTQGSGIPSGVIVAWSGSITHIPPGLHICDGTSGTPDLRSRFIVGAGSELSTKSAWGNGWNVLGSGYYGVGNTGGEEQHILTIPEMPSHNHNIKFRAYGGSGSTGWDGSNDINLTNTFPSTNTGGDMPHNTLPPYFSLAFIMKL